MTSRAWGNDEQGAGKRRIKSLAGRAQPLTLYSFSQAELEQQPGSFIDVAFDGHRLLDHTSVLTRADYLGRACQGGYPEALTRSTASRREEWYDTYLMQITNRDASDISGLQRLADLPRLLRFIAARSGSSMVWSFGRASLHQYRDQRGREVDVVLESPDGRIVGIEVKTSGTVQSKDLAGLSTLLDRLRDRFVHGYVLFTGPRARMVADRVTALPLDALWTIGSGAPSLNGRGQRSRSRRWLISAPEPTCRSWSSDALHASRCIS